MKQLDIVIQNPTGLHARPAKVFVTMAKGYKSDIRVFNGEKKANAKSLISLLTLGVESGSAIRIEVDGEDEDAALTALEQAILSGLGEEELIERVAAAAEPTPEVDPLQKPQPPQTEPATLPENCIQGIPGAPGIAIGPIYHLKRSEIKVEETFEGESAEKNQLQAAIEQAKGQVARLHAQMLAQDAGSEAAIFMCIWNYWMMSSCSMPCWQKSTSGRAQLWRGNPQLMRVPSWLPAWMTPCWPPAPPICTM
jgi:phosphocarrier protein FPr